MRIFCCNNNCNRKLLKVIKLFLDSNTQKNLIVFFRWQTAGFVGNLDSTLFFWRALIYPAFQQDSSTETTSSMCLPVVLWWHCYSSDHSEERLRAGQKLHQGRGSFVLLQKSTWAYAWLSFLTVLTGLHRWCRLICFIKVTLSKAWCSHPWTVPKGSSINQILIAVISFRLKIINLIYPMIINAGY